ncbi:uncharacterized protein LOC109723383 [Ananas comosus]|uniref:Uncharacterized protein LOC109723383 n=1 Tax=Ananas comosus TaxID=4615 RepID=A0A199VYJ8_ANACO|nr:uncharacterized protein LOC109723383 [Ananas comosus]OAY81775.1 hypothetical protein ACMD2_17323 [Ananas comosus]
MGSLGMKMERKSSIESEPRTLTLEQLRFAREAALYVLSTKTAEEAFRIFTDGLKPMLTTMRSETDSDDEAEMIDCVVMDDHINNLLIKKDIVTAPF